MLRESRKVVYNWKSRSLYSNSWILLFSPWAVGSISWLGRGYWAWWQQRRCTRRPETWRRPTTCTGSGSSGCSAALASHWAQIRCSFAENGGLFGSNCWNFYNYQENLHRSDDKKRPGFCQAHSAWRRPPLLTGRSLWRSQRRCWPWRRRWWWCRWSRREPRRYGSYELAHGQLRWSLWRRRGCPAIPRRSWWRRGWAWPRPRCQSWTRSSPSPACAPCTDSLNHLLAQNILPGILPQSGKDHINIILLSLDQVPPACFDHCTSRSVPWTTGRQWLRTWRGGGRWRGGCCRCSSQPRWRTAPRASDPWLGWWLCKGQMCCNFKKWRLRIQLQNSWWIISTWGDGEPWELWESWRRRLPQSWCERRISLRMGRQDGQTFKSQIIQKS